MEDLFYLDAMLTLAGNRMNSRIWGIRNLGRISNWIIRMLITVSTIIGMYLMWMNTVPVDGMTPQLITQLTGIILGLAATVWFAVKRRQIKKLINVIAENDLYLNELNRKFLRALILISGGLLNNLVLHYLTIRSWRLSDLLTNTYFLISIPIVLNQFMAFYPLLYLTCIRLLTAYEVEHIQKIKSLINSGMIDVMHIIRQRNEVMSIKREFESLFNVVPFAMLGNMFITIPGGIIILTSLKKSQMVSDWLEYALFHALVLVLIYQLVQTVSRCHEKVRDKTSDLIVCIQEKIIKDPQTRGYQSLIDGLM